MRERNLEGYFPVKTGHQNFGKEGDLPTFTIRKKMADGQMTDITYKLNGPIVRKVLTPEQEAAEKAQHQAALAAHYAQRKNQSSARRARSTSEFKGDCAHPKGMKNSPLRHGGHGGGRMEQETLCPPCLRGKPFLA